MCPEALVLSEYFDGEITESRKVELDRHIEECPACRAFLEAFAWQRRLLQSDTYDVPRDTGGLERFWAYVGHSRFHQFRTFRRISVPLPLAVAALIVLFAASILNFIPLNRSKGPEVVIVESRPVVPTVISFNVAPGELENLFAVLEGTDTGVEVLHTLPENYSFTLLGEPQMVRPASLGGDP